MSDDQDGSHRDPPRSRQFKPSQSGNPPRSRRFKPGQSGNPRGRPRGTRNVWTDLTQLLNKRIAIREDGETRHISRQEAILLSLYSKAVRGDVRAIMSILTMLMKLEPATASKPDQDEVSQTDQEIIDDYWRRKAAIQAQNKESPTISDAVQDDVSQKEIVEDSHNAKRNEVDEPSTAPVPDQNEAYQEVSEHIEDRRKATTGKREKP
jgi:hypothetical protein